MSNVWSQFASAVDEVQLQKDLESARQNSFEDLPAGTYVVKFTKIEAKLTKQDKQPMLAVTAKVLEGQHKNRLMFMNRKIKGTKNDANMIASAEGWLAKLEAEDETGELIVPHFRNYEQFAEQIMDIGEAVEELDLVYQVTYDTSKFNSISIDKILD